MPREINRIRVTHPSGGESKTRQSDALKTDVNSIVARWVTTGVVPLVGGTPKYGDFSTHSDYHTALNQVRQAEEDFMNLPIQVRKLCENDPGKFVEMIHSPEGRAQLDAIGMPEDRVPDTAPEPAPPVKETIATTPGE